MVNLGPNESNSVFMPITTAQYLYNAVGKADRLFMVLSDEYESGEYYQKFDEIIRNNHQIHPDDMSAFVTLDMKSQLNQFDIMIGGINALVWLVGLGTLLAGLIGISNIMMVTVKERTQEIGVRRALGAEPWTIIKQIMCESLVLTLAAGILGIVVGVWGLYFVNRMTATGESGFFANPHVPFIPAIAAFIILILGGLFAGFVPAKRALAIKAIEALRAE
ncbi:MAG: ABC transporter permease [Bacteroidales bacterium]|nr:ABC transporter permease [Bacteroidales bacterium]